MFHVVVLSFTVSFLMSDDSYHSLQVCMCTTCCKLYHFCANRAWFNYLSFKSGERNTMPVYEKMLTHSERRPQNIYSLEEKTLYFIIKLATQISFFSLQISNTWCFVKDKMKYEHLAILSNLKSCQFAPRIAFFNLSMCCQFEDLQIISPKIILMSLWQMRALSCRKFFSFGT